MRRTTVAILAAALCAVWLMPAVAQAQSRIGFVDLGRALEMTELGRRIQRKLASKRDELEIRSREMELEILNLRDEINRQGEIWPEETLRQKRRELMQTQQEYQVFAERSAMEFQMLNLRLLKQFVTKVQEIATRIAQSDGYAMVLMKADNELAGTSLILYAAGEYDLTDRVVRMLNEAEAENPTSTDVESDSTN